MSNLSTSLPSVTGYDSVGDTEPEDKEAGTTWYDTSVPTGKVYTGSQWVEESAPAGGSGITLSGGQYDVATGDGLTISSGAVALLLSGDLTIDGNGDLALSFDPATQTELDDHTGDTTNPHSVDHSELSGVGQSDHHAPTPVAASENFPADLTHYTGGGNGTVIDTTGSGVLLGGEIQGGNNTSVSVTITADGSSATFDSISYNIDSGGTNWYVPVPPVEFSNDLQVDVNNDCDGYSMFLKQ